MVGQIRGLALAAAAVATLCGTGCRRDMADQPKLKPLAASNFFPDGAASRPQPAHTVARDDLPAPAEPPVTGALLTRGQERYDIYCSVCHGRLGDGQGMIVQRGFPTPPTFHQQRLRDVPDAHYYDVMTNGFGLMYSYATRVPPPDRWAITAYIRALQFSQHATLADADAGALTALKSTPQ